MSVLLKPVGVLCELLRSRWNEPVGRGMDVAELSPVQAMCTYQSPALTTFMGRKCFHPLWVFWGVKSTVADT